MSNSARNDKKNFGGSGGFAAVSSQFLAELVLMVSKSGTSAPPLKDVLNFFLILFYQYGSTSLILSDESSSQWLNQQKHNILATWNDLRIWKSRDELKFGSH